MTTALNCERECSAANCQMAGVILELNDTLDAGQTLDEAAQQEVEQLNAYCLRFQENLQLVRSLRNSQNA